VALQIESELIHLVLDADGVVHVDGTRVTLDTVIAAFSDGATSEEIAQQYPALRLADVYAILGFYLRKRPEVRSLFTPTATAGGRCAPTKRGAI
jgi:uncharacterized protein (DUF433 family)